MMMRIAAIALLLAIIPIALATYGNGTVYSLGSATISTQGGIGGGSAYTTSSRMDFRPVALGNGTYFDAHMGFWEIAPELIPTEEPEPGVPRVTSISVGQFPWYWFIIVGFMSMGLTIVFVKMGRGWPLGVLPREEEDE